jgi:hypothetical protein
VTWPLLAFGIFVGLLCLFIGWFFDRAQKALDRRYQLDDEAWRESLRRLPP